MKKYAAIFLSAFIYIPATGQVFKSFLIDSLHSSRVDNITAFGNRVFFTADDGIHGTELWTTDGTDSGTVLVKDIFAGSGSSSPAELIPFGDKLYFSANDSIHGQELWSTDGTDTGTVLVSDISPGEFGSNPNEFIVLNGKLLFSTWDTSYAGYMYATQGEDSTTEMIYKLNVNLDVSVLFNGKLIFEGVDSLGAEPWITDGTTEGTHRLKDINSGGELEFSSEPRSFAVYNGKVFFSARQWQMGRELWVTDGTEAGTVLFKELMPGTESSNPNQLRMFNNKLYFSATTSAGSELWVSDGTPAGTVLLKDISPGAASSSPSWFYAFNGNLYFFANNGTHGQELWKSGGTTAGTVMVKDINPSAGFSQSALHAYVILNNQLYFTAEYATGDTRLFRTNGTAAGTTLIGQPVQPAVVNPFRFPAFRGFTRMGDDFYFGAEFIPGKTYLYSYGAGTAGSENMPHNPEILLYPNPVKDLLNVVGFSGRKPQQLRILDCSGRQVYSERLVNNPAQLDLGFLPGGIYMILLSGDDGAWSGGKIILSR